MLEQALNMTTAVAVTVQALVVLAFFGALTALTLASFGIIPASF